MLRWYRLALDPRLIPQRRASSLKRDRPPLSWRRTDGEAGPQRIRPFNRKGGPTEKTVPKHGAAGDELRGLAHRPCSWKRRHAGLAQRDIRPSA